MPTGADHGGRRCRAGLNPVSLEIGKAAWNVVDPSQTSNRTPLAVKSTLIQDNATWESTVVNAVVWSSGVAAVVTGLAALVAGSFIGVVIARLPAGRSIVGPPSSCDHCGRRLAARDLVPLASWLASAGRCRHCGHALGAFYPLVELAALAVAGSALAVLPERSASLLVVSLVLGWTLLALAWIDARWLILPDRLTVPLVAAGIAAAWLLGAPLVDRLIGAVVGFLALAALAAGYRRVRGRDGMGLGDAKLLAAAGAWLGWQALPSVLLVAALIGLVVAAGLAARRRRDWSRLRIPFGPPLALAIWLAWLFGPIVWP
jgi:leader peptidase (prepilin peptidase)/N-methyltransferase